MNMKKTKLPGEKVKDTAYPQVTSNFLICPGQYMDQGSCGESRQTSNGSAIDNSAIRTWLKPSVKLETTWK